MDLEALFARLHGVRRTEGGGLALCPVQEEHGLSVSVSVHINEIRIECQAGCRQELLLERLGMEARQLFVSAGEGERVESASEIVDGARLLDSISAYIRRFVSLSEVQARVAAVWVVHTHVFEAAETTLYLAVTSAEKQSGKTRFLEVLGMLVKNPWLTGRVTAAVLPRKIQAQRPTLLLDESDAAFNGPKEYTDTLRGVLDTGYLISGKTTCCVREGTNISFADFSTFCPKVIAGIGKLPDTIADRAIPIRLKRAKRNEKVEKFRRRRVASEAAELSTLIKAWCSAIIQTLRNAEPQAPEELTDRQADGAEPLLAIADAAGAAWPQGLRESLISLCCEAQAGEGSLCLQLLADIRRIFEVLGVDRIKSADLVAALCELETSPWLITN
jgi:hypothetical protein